MEAHVDMPTVEVDEFDAYWRDVLRRYSVVVIDPSQAQPIVVNATAPIGYHNLMTLVGSTNIIRLPLRSIYGLDAHAYSLGFWASDDASRTEFDAAPVNEQGVEIASRHNLEAEVRGRIVIVTADAIDPRDLQPELIEADAETMPEVERDHARVVGPAADAEWAKLVEALEGDMVPSMVTTAPSMDRIAWLTRLILVGIDTDIVAHAAMNELLAKRPVLRQAFAALWHIQAAHFTGQIETLTPDEDMRGPPRVPKPKGWSERHGQVLH